MALTMDLGLVHDASSTLCPNPSILLGKARPPRSPQALRPHLAEPQFHGGFDDYDGDHAGDGYDGGVQTYAYWIAHYGDSSSCSSSYDVVCLVCDTQAQAH
ncbi:hypothetical protein FGRMN_4848 [Fusarium graminum]|nr:hypothetical protein FGRMN_4848 [Fusarium graminum]